MSGPAPFAVFWGTLNAVLGIGLIVWSGVVGIGLLLVQGGLVIAAFGALQAWHRPTGDPRLLPRFSLPTVVLGTGLAAAAVGLTAGAWLVLVGGEIALFGAVWLAREVRAERRIGPGRSASREGRPR